MQQPRNADFIPYRPFLYKTCSASPSRFCLPGVCFCGTIDLAAIQQGIDDMEAGRGVPAEEADRRLREKRGLFSCTQRSTTSNEKRPPGIREILGRSS